MAPYNNLAGLRFGDLQVMSDTGIRRYKKVVWLCRCKCGNTREVVGSFLTTGKITCCKDCAKQHHQTNAIRHNIRHSLRNVWYHMKDRCENPLCEAYPYYGGRGISICKEWSENKEVFIDWALSNGYAFGLTIERIDVNGNYCPENCKWITQREQSYNRRTSVMVHYRGKKVSLARMCYDLNLDIDKILHYLRKHKKYFDDE